MSAKGNNYAFIDSQNLHQGVLACGWLLDLQKFRVYLKDKYGIEKAFVFIGYHPRYLRLYNMYEQSGFVCIYKPVILSKDGKMKGNCDAELLLHSMIEFSCFDRAIIISGDGDFQCLIKYFLEQDKLLGVMIPDRRHYSALLKHKNIRPFLRFVNDLEQRLSKKEKTP